jgi:hypothetical protein
VFEDIIKLIESDIRVEAAKDKLDIVAIKNLVEIEQHVQSRAIESVDQASNTMYAPARMAPGVRAMPAGGYGPGPTERLIDQVMAMFEKQSQNQQRISLAGLAQSYAELQKIEPEYAARIKVLLESKIKEEEARDASIHSELPGGCESVDGGGQHRPDV